MAAKVLVFQTYAHNNSRIKREMDALLSGSSQSICFVSDAQEAEQRLEEILTGSDRPLVISSEVFRAPILGCWTGSGLATKIKRRREDAFFILFSTNAPEELEGIRFCLLKDEAGWRVLVDFLVEFVKTGQLAAT